jgi:hypothetical protein
MGLGRLRAQGAVGFIPFYFSVSSVALWCKILCVVVDNCSQGSPSSSAADCGSSPDSASLHPGYLSRKQKRRSTDRRFYVQGGTVCRKCLEYFFGDVQGGTVCRGYREQFPGASSYSPCHQKKLYTSVTEVWVSSSSISSATSVL